MSKSRGTLAGFLAKGAKHFFLVACLLASGVAMAGTKVQFSTSQGDFVIELDDKEAPVTVGNFLQYVDDGFYDGIIMHRIIPGFVIQGGGFLPGLQPKQTRPPIPNEADNGLKNDKYTLSMARTSDPHSASSQFFINLNNNVPLDHTGKNASGWGYAVFGRVVDGQSVIDAMGKVATTTKLPYENVPEEDVIILSARRI